MSNFQFDEIIRLRLCFSSRRVFYLSVQAKSHDVTRVTGVAASNPRNSPGTELFIDAPSNKLFSGQRASRSSDDGVVLPYKRADDFYETKCRGVVIPRDVALFGSAVSATTTTLPRSLRRLPVEKYHRENKRRPRRISSKDALTHCVGFLQWKNGRSEFLSYVYLTLGETLSPPLVRYIIKKDTLETLIFKMTRNAYLLLSLSMCHIVSTADIICI